MQKVLAIVGPTASGKTKISVEIAKRLNGEIISADSRQIYKHIAIASAQPSLELQKQVRHYFINELELNEEFNSGEFGIKGRKIIKNILSRGKVPLITGGSGLYIKSLIDGFFDEQIKSKEIREKLYENLKNKGEEFLYDELKKVDKESYAAITPGKIRRVIRALEVYYVSGKKISELQKKNPEIYFETIQIGLMHDRKILYERINRRVDEMLAAGLIDEVKQLKEKGYHYKANYSLDTVGIKEVFKFLEGEFDYVEMVRLIKQNCRRYAKRQLTWFRKDKRINWIEMDARSDEDVVNDIEKLFLSL